ncbi:MAG: hypothetical protein M0R06_02860 [Sphaerochaeta sp.]|jgi:hypothetical protein|nr:hypothetical protein [Sphaerochaeta sp.]
MAKKLIYMTESEIGYMLNRIAKNISSETDALFFLVVFDDQGVAQYISNAKREDCIKAMEETVVRFKNKDVVERK